MHAYINMNCACVGGDVDYYMQEICNEIRKARKIYTCYECNEFISINDKYEYFLGKDEDNELIVYRTCLSCTEIRTKFSINGSWTWGFLWEDMENCFPDLIAGGPCIEGLSVKAKEKLFSRWRQWKGVAK